MSSQPSTASSGLSENLRIALGELDQASLRRRRRTVDSACGPLVTVQGRELLAFASNDYLGLANHPALHEAAIEGLRTWGVGAGASHLVSGHTSAHDALEQKLAAFVGSDAALVFSTGYMANIGVLPALVGRDDAIFADRLNHASLVDGALLSRASLHRYPHADMSALARMLRAQSARRKVIVSDAVFSMDGDIAPLEQLLALADEHDAWLLIDDAHGFGVLGPQGRGSLAAAGLQSDRLIIMGTLGKAAGVSGAFVAGAESLIEWLLQKSRSYVFTTAMPPHLAHTLLRSIDLVSAADPQRSRLAELVSRLRAGLGGHSARLMPSSTAIQPLILGENKTAVATSEALLERGIWVPAIRPPTVPKGTARLRISLSAAHTVEQVDRLTGALRPLLDGLTEVRQ